MASSKSASAPAVSTPAASMASFNNLRTSSKVRKSEKEIDPTAGIVLGVAAAALLVGCVADFCKGGGSN
jgi:hypothetical protein